MAFQFTDGNFHESALDNTGVTVIDFGAEWCGPCHTIAPIIEQLANDYEGQVLIGKMDIDDNPETSTKYKVMSIPTILILRNGEVVDRNTGLLSKQALQNKIENALGLPA